MVINSHLAVSMIFPFRGFFVVFRGNKFLPQLHQAIIISQKRFHTLKPACGAIMMRLWRLSIFSGRLIIFGSLNGGRKSEVRCGDCWAAEGKRGDVILILMRRNDGEAEKESTGIDYSRSEPWINQLTEQTQSHGLLITLTLSWRLSLRSVTNERLECEPCFGCRVTWLIDGTRILRSLLFQELFFSPSGCFCNLKVLFGWRSRDKVWSVVGWVFVESFSECREKKLLTKWIFLSTTIRIQRDFNNLKWISMLRQIHSKSPSKYNSAFRSSSSLDVMNKI